jgi:uncharacterized membrane protein
MRYRTSRKPSPSFISSILSTPLLIMSFQTLCRDGTTVSLTALRVSVAITHPACVTVAAMQNRKMITGLVSLAGWFRVCMFQSVDT